METTLSRRIMMNASKAIEENVALFYQQKQKEGYDMLDNTLAFLIQATSSIIDTQIHHDESLIDQEELNVILSKAMAAIENGDTILLSDILFFDLKPILDKSL